MKVARFIGVGFLPREPEASGARGEGEAEADVDAERVGVSAIAPTVGRTLQISSHLDRRSRSFTRAHPAARPRNSRAEPRPARPRHSRSCSARPTSMLANRPAEALPARHAAARPPRPPPLRTTRQMHTWPKCTETSSSLASTRLTMLDRHVVCARVQRAVVAAPRLARADADICRSVFPGAAGPVDPAGRVATVSERNLFCLSVHGDHAVVGGADHGLHEIELRGGAAGAPLRRRRELYTRAHGHSEWVTDVAHLPDGRVVSAGMDSKLCVWNAAGAPRCAELLGHTGSVSAVRVSADGASRSQRRTTNPSAVAPRRRRRRRHAAAGAPRAGAPARLRGRRAGVGRPRRRRRRVGPRRGAAATALGRHGGHATALATDGSDALLSGGQDGVVRLWDLRAASQAAETAVHGAGAVNELVHHRLPSGQPLVLSAGADGASSRSSRASRSPRSTALPTIATLCTR